MALNTHTISKRYRRRNRKHVKNINKWFSTKYRKEKLMYNIEPYDIRLFMKDLSYVCKVENLMGH